MHSLPRFISPPYLNLNVKYQAPLPSRIQDDWLSQEIARISAMVQIADALNPYANPYKLTELASQQEENKDPIISKPQFIQTITKVEDKDPNADSQKTEYFFETNEWLNKGEPENYFAFIDEDIEVEPKVENDNQITNTQISEEEKKAVEDNHHKFKYNTSNNWEIDKNQSTDDNNVMNILSSNHLELHFVDGTLNTEHTDESNLQKKLYAKKQFASTPKDEEFYKNLEFAMPIMENSPPTTKFHEGGNRGPLSQSADLMMPRPIRQNPMNKQKHLLEPELAKLKSGLATKDYRVPISLLPSNLRWLKINHVDDTESVSQSDLEDGIHVVDADPDDSVYSYALIAVCAAGTLMAATFGIGFGWYTLSRRAKAAADVDYPGYGVTGPSVDSTGDRKLAHSAHMYHYQHQKQQILAMERSCLEQRHGSFSDAESEEENEEGDYTVYECPGFATTGEMEVRNPLFTEDPAPATPGKCQVVKPQPKN